MASELQEKLGRLRKLLRQQGADAAYLERAGNLSWLLCGGDAVVAPGEPPVARAVVTADEARVFAAEFERDRLEVEEVPEGLQVVYLPWQEPEAFDGARLALAQPEHTVTDGWTPDMKRIDFTPVRTPLLPGEVERYRALGSDAAAAVGAVLRGLEPEQSEREIAGEVARELHKRGIQPAMLLVGGDGRLKRFRQPVPSAEAAHERVLVTISARRHGLHANLSRLAAFTPLGPQEARRYRSLLEIEAAALAVTRHGRFYRDVLTALQRAYADHLQPLAWKYHHQGGRTGYFTNDVVASPGSESVISQGSAFSWNPSLPGLRVEDTVLLEGHSLEFLTVDPEWPMIEIEGRQRPDVLLLG